MRISLASPVYNESELIQEFIHKAVKALHDISDDFEIVLVNDCSTDDTLFKIKELLPEYPCIKLINLTKNSGQHIASSIALQHTTGEYVFMMDSDMQVNPDYMVEFFNHGRTNQHWDVISALRITRSANLYRRIGSNIISGILRTICKTKLKDVGSTFKLIKRKALDKLLAQDILIQNLPILMMNLNLKIVEYPIRYNNIQERGSHYKFVDLVFTIILALLNFSTGGGTLLLLVLLGCFFSFTGIVGVLGIIAWGVVQQSALPTNLLIFVLILSVIGIQFILLGMIVFKLERINKNLDFKKAIKQRIEYEN
jgi:glycosyltransferase involved in cell wall biosynthesis